MTRSCALIQRVDCPPEYPDPVVVGAPTGHASMAIRMISGRSGHRLGRLSGIDVRHDDALHPPIQKTQDRGILVIGDAHDRGDAEHLGGPHHVFHLVQTHRAVLAVDHDEVIADQPEQLHQVWAWRLMMAPNTTLPSVSFAFVALVRMVLASSIPPQDGLSRRQAVGGHTDPSFQRRLGQRNGLRIGVLPLRAGPATAPRGARR